MYKTMVQFSVGIFLAGVISLQADDWPQWRGPNRDGVSRETGLLRQWPKEGPKLLWQNKEVGAGYSSVAIVGDHLYTIGNEGLENESVHALSVKTGKNEWSARLGPVGNPNQQPDRKSTR